ncbi:MAG TPA: phosphotransferase [Pyrinomonadaceae bacterium]
MLPEVITSVEQVTPEWLTETLRRNGFLERGRVKDVSVEVTRTMTVSIVSRLVASYAPGAAPHAPAHLFLKLSNPDFQPDAPCDRPPAEIVFYTSVVPEMPDPPVVRCYDSAYSRSTGRSHLLLEDLSETHQQPSPHLPPTVAESEREVDALAAVHAHWWEHPRLGKDIGRLLGASDAEEIARRNASDFARFADFLGDRLSPARRSLYERAFSVFPKPWQRLTKAKGLTLTHGDAHFGNFLHPLDAEGGRTYLVDWQLWHPHIGPRDLAYMMTLFWYPERRARMEETLLRRYHRGLAAGGVGDYTWEECFEDYRWSALRNIFIPILQWTRGQPGWLWWSQLEKSLAAFEDLRCIELVEG